MAEEKRFEAKVRKFLKEQGAWHVKYWGGGSFTRAGVPDILACVNGVFVAVEVKAADGRPTALQRLNIMQVNGAGGIGVVLYPDGFEAFKKLIMEVRKCNIAIPGLTALKAAVSNTGCDTSTS